jgi:hypothetical protein
VRERRGRALQGSIDLSKCQESLSNPRLEYIYSPFPIPAVMGKTRTSRTVLYALADCPHLNSNGKNAKSTTGRTVRWVGRTVCQDPAYGPIGPRGLSSGRPRTIRPVHRAAPYSVKNTGPSAWGPRTVMRTRMRTSPVHLHQQHLHSRHHLQGQSLGLVQES